MSRTNDLFFLYNKPASFHLRHEQINKQNVKVAWHRINQRRRKEEKEKRKQNEMFVFLSSMKRRM